MTDIADMKECCHEFAKYEKLHVCEKCFLEILRLARIGAALEAMPKLRLDAEPFDENGPIGDGDTPLHALNEVLADKNMEIVEPSPARKSFKELAQQSIFYANDGGEL